LLREARRRHPQVRFAAATLPDLVGIERASFANVLCETVVMHLDPAAVTPAVDSLLGLLIPGGILYLSWRVTEGKDRRDEHGRLYAAFDPERVLRALATSEILLDEQVGSVSSGKLIRRIVARKRGPKE
jgi:SAM-dependent methyltransferase